MHLCGGIVRPDRRRACTGPQHRRRNLQEGNQIEHINIHLHVQGAQPVTIRLDADVIAWFKQTAPQYQTAVNKVLRDYMEQHAANDAAPQQAKKKRG